MAFVSLLFFWHLSYNVNKGVVLGTHSMRPELLDRGRTAYLLIDAFVAHPTHCNSCITLASKWTSSLPLSRNALVSPSSQATCIFFGRVREARALTEPVNDNNRALGVQATGNETCSSLERPCVNRGATLSGDHCWISSPRNLAKASIAPPKPSTPVIRSPRHHSLTTERGGLSSDSRAAATAARATWWNSCAWSVLWSLSCIKSSTALSNNRRNGLARHFRLNSTLSINSSNLSLFSESGTGVVSDDVNTTKERANSRLKECWASRNSAQVRRDRAKHHRSSGKVATVCSSSANNSEPANNARVVAPDSASSARKVRVAAPPRNHGFVVPSSSRAALSRFASRQATTTAWATTSGRSRATRLNNRNQGLVGE